MDDILEVENVDRKDVLSKVEYDGHAPHIRLSRVNSIEGKIIGSNIMKRMLEHMEADTGSML